MHAAAAAAATGVAAAEGAAGGLGSGVVACGCPVRGAGLAGRTQCRVHKWLRRKKCCNLLVAMYDLGRVPRMFLATC